MLQALPAFFANWQNFYVIMGSAAGALIGVQFIVLTLIAQIKSPTHTDGIRAFATPTLAHFCTALAISALMVVPWPSLTALGVCLGICGTVGVIYSLRTVAHARSSPYDPDIEDWFWYAALPFVAHLLLAAAAVLMWWNCYWSTNLLAFDTLLFLVLGIRNSWDSITFIALKHVSAAVENDLTDQPGRGDV